MHTADVPRIRHLSDPSFARSDVSTHVVIGRLSFSLIAEVDAVEGRHSERHFSRSLQGVANKRARTRLRSHPSSHPPPSKPTCLALNRSASFGYKSDDGVGVLSDRSKTHYIPHPCASAIADVSLEFSVEEQALARR